MVHELPVEGNGRLNAFDNEFVEGSLHALNGLLAVAAGANEFGNHRVVVRGNRIARINVGVDAHAVAPRGVERGNLAWARTKVVVGIFGVDAALDGVLVRLVVASRNHNPAGNFNLLPN